MSEPTTPVKRAMLTMGEHVVLMRKINRLTAKRTAARAGVSLTTLRNFERGENVEFTTALEILRAVGLLDQVVAGADPLESSQGRARLAAFLDGQRT
ncbi:MAG: helix-turn-helix domain-containing protein [Pseudoclavibacter sp.]